MRIIAGKLKGRRLEAPDWTGLRPTSDRLRETLFNVLAPHIVGARFLDGFAGTGAVGIEALSRGAAEVVFVDEDRRAAGLIGRNLERCGLRDGYTIDCSAFPGRSRNGATPFDIVFLDPPYGGAGLIGALDAAAPLVGEHTLLVVEHATRDQAPADRGVLRQARTLRSGDSALGFYRLAPTGDGEDIAHG